jgi:type IV pilus assembly protein PilN
MAQINLLPWREERRKQRQQRFYLTWGLSILGTIVAVYLWHGFIQSRIEYQQARNQRLQHETAELDRQITEIHDLQETRRQLLARMNVIEHLQEQRSVIVHLFDELVNTLPEGVYLTALQQTGNSLTLNGNAQSNARVSTYMKQLDASPWLADPELLVIETKRQRNRSYSQFSLKVNLTPSPSEAERKS